MYYFFAIPALTLAIILAGEMHGLTKAFRAPLAAAIRLAVQAFHFLYLRPPTDGQEADEQFFTP